MIPVWWSVLLTAVGVLGLWLAGRRNTWGWAVGLAAQTLWIAYAIVTKQWGFIGSALAYGWVYGRNFLQWRREARFQRCGECEPQPASEWPERLFREGEPPAITRGDA